MIRMSLCIFIFILVLTVAASIAVSGEQTINTTIGVQVVGYDDYVYCKENYQGLIEECVVNGMQSNEGVVQFNVQEQLDNLDNVAVDNTSTAVNY